ncbi:MAG TPA: DMT family transporter [Stellaceae bacterium]|nr:DMT family transporter [Stellaceae bacterium]
MTSEAASEKTATSEQAGRGGTALVWCAASAALLIWGATPMVTRIAVLEIEPSAVGILRTVLAAVLALPLGFALRLARPRGTSQWGQLFVSAVGGFVLFPVLFGLGVRHTSASHAALVLAVSPLFTGLIAGAVERRAPSRTWWIGAGLAFAGEVALVAFRADIGQTDASLDGDLLVLVACISAAAGYVAGARLSRKITTWATTFWGIGLGGAILLPLAALRLGPQAWGDAGALGWSAVIYLALGSTIVGYICWYWALQRGGIARIGATQFAQPVIALGFAVAVLREPLTPPLMLAALLVVAGVTLAQRR